MINGQITGAAKQQRPDYITKGRLPKVEYEIVPFEQCVEFEQTEVPLLGSYESIDQSIDQSIN